MLSWDQAQKNELKYWQHWRDDLSLKSAEESEIRRRLREKNLHTLLNLPHGYGVSFFQGKTVADIGCGPNPLVAIDGISFKKAYCIDPLNNQYNHILKHKDSFLEYINASGENIPLPDQSIDVVICINALDHMSKPVEALQEINRILKFNGELFLTLLFNEGDDECHPHSIGLKELLNMLECAGFYLWQNSVSCTYEGIVEPLSIALVARKYPKLSFFGNKQISIYGAGSAGGKLYNKLIKFIPEESVSCYIDSNSAAWGNQKNGKPILQFEKDICQKILEGKMVVLIASTTGQKQISELLIKFSLEEGKHFFNGLQLFNIPL